MDTLTVWKRTKTSIMGKHIYAYIPTSERLDLVAACDETRHLLDENTREHKEAKKKRQRKN
jgi:hypothetical protein